MRGPGTYEFLPIDAEIQSPQLNNETRFPKNQNNYAPPDATLEIEPKDQLQQHSRESLYRSVAARKSNNRFEIHEEITGRSYGNRRQ